MLGDVHDFLGIQWPCRFQTCANGRTTESYSRDFYGNRKRSRIRLLFFDKLAENLLLDVAQCDEF